MSAMLTAKDAAEELGVAAETVRAWCKDGTLRAINVASDLNRRAAWRIERAALDQFKDSRRSSPAPKPSRRRRDEREVIRFSDWV